MGEKIIIAICDMFLPLTMLGLGLMIWKTRPPYGDMFGYRTTQSLKSPEAWTLAQELFGRYCTTTYAALCAITLIAGIVPIVFRLEELAVEWLVTVVNLTDFLALFVVIVCVDRTVKRAFPNKEK